MSDKANSDGSEIWFEPETGSTVINETTVPSPEIWAAIQDQAPEIATLVRWGNSVQPNRHGTIFERDRYVTPKGIYQQFQTALDASENDDVVSGVLESTEALAFNKVEMSCDDEQEEDIWNQIIEDLDLDRHLREMWRETFMVSQFYAAVLWETKDFKVKGKTKNGNKSKKAFKSMKVPTALTILDPMKVIPVGNTLFGQEELAYLATKDEAPHFDLVLAGANSTDQVVDQLIVGKYDLEDEAGRKQRQWIMEVTGARNLENLYRLNPDQVFRHTATKPDYMRFSPVRMKSVFELLDLKHQLRQMDRSFLLAGTNFIILVKRGSENMPAKQDEVNAMASQIRATSRIPMIVSDHRIEIEIITPDVDLTLKPERYNTLDARITARLYQMFMTGNYAAGASGDDSLKLARVVARGMESRRYMIYKTLERNIFKPTYMKNDEFTSAPTMNFHPKRIALDFDNNVATFMQDLRDRGDISRDTLLSEVDVDQDDEARRREREKERFDKVFTPTNVPFSGGAPGGAPGEPGAPGGAVPATPKGAGRQGGGNSNGGGANRQSGVSQPGRGTVPATKVKNPGKPAA